MHEAAVPKLNDPRSRADREYMVYEQLHKRGIRDRRVLDAMNSVPREGFVPAELASSAYADAALPITCSQTISQPYMVARMTELLEPTPAHRVLEVGTGSGYQTAVLAMLSSEVFTIEWHSALLEVARSRLASLGFSNIRFRCGDGSLGWPDAAPFHAILVTAGGPDVPEPLCEQLAQGGILVVPIGPADDQILVRVRRTPTGFRREEVLKCRFVPLRGAAGWDESNARPGEI